MLEWFDAFTDSGSFFGSLLLKFVLVIALLVAVKAIAWVIWLVMPDCWLKRHLFARTTADLPQPRNPPSR